MNFQQLRYVRAALHNDLNLTEVPTSFSRPNRASANRSAIWRPNWASTSLSGAAKGWSA
jgi:hypothetical protein